MKYLKKCKWRSGWPRDFGDYLVLLKSGDTMAIRVSDCGDPNGRFHFSDHVEAIVSKPDDKLLIDVWGHATKSFGPILAK